MGLKAQRQTGVPLDVVRRVARARLNVDPHAVGAWMDRKRIAVLGAGLIDRIVLALPEGRSRAGVHHHLHKMRVSRPALDLPRRCLGVLVRHRDRALAHTVGVVAGQPGVG